MANYKKIIEKRHKEEEATAFAFQEFIDTFQNVAPAGKTFIKSGVYNSGGVQESQEDKGKLYNPMPVVKVPAQETNKKAIECARLVKENKYDRSKCGTRPKSNLEQLKEELRQRHMERDTRHKQQKANETYTLADSLDTTTNLFLTNLNPKLNEQNLMQIFGLYGPLASVKIMWPRTEDWSRSSNVGFVAFMSRKDSERAFENLSNRDDMRISWGKPIEIPTQPVYIPPDIVKMLLPPPYSGLPFNAQPLNKNFKFPENDDEIKTVLRDAIVKVTIPLDKKNLMVIHRMIEFVVREGPMFEAMIMHKEINNPSFHFLFDNKSAAHVYYRWKLFSVMKGESNLNWSTKPFRMFKEGSIWIPPTLPDYTKGMDLKPAKNIAVFLSDNQQCRLIQLIKNLTMARCKVMDAMLFCLKHADAAKDVVSIISESFDNNATNACSKIARLYLISDILFNIKSKRNHLRNFQEMFENRLIKIFESLEHTYSDLIEMNDKNAFKSRVLTVLRIWEMWRVYPGEFLDKLESIFENCDESEIDEPLDGKALITRSLNYNPDCVVVPEVKIIIKEENHLDNFVQSKWETLDPAEIEAQAMSTQKLHDIEMARLERERSQQERCVEYEKLRNAELKVVKYQDELESGKRKPRKHRSIEEEVNEYRRKCVERVKRNRKSIDSSPISSDSFSSDSSGEVRRKKKRKRECVKHKKYRR